MRVAKFSLTLITLLALLAWVALDVLAQAQPSSKATQQSPAPAKKPPAAKAPAAKSAPQAPAPAKQPAKKPARARVLVADTPSVPPLVARRDPFNPLIRMGGSGGPVIPDRLPPGKAGLIIGNIRVDGLVQGPNGMIAVVSNPTQRVYFLREGDQVYDGRVQRITMDFVAFHEVGKDAFGKPIERQVIKRLYPSPGEIR